MRAITLSIGAVLLLAAGLCAQDAQDSAAQAAQMEAYMELMQPGPEHKLLETMAGSWNLKVTIWMQAGAEPMIFEGTAEQVMILGGRFLESKFAAGDGPFATQGLTILGFDRRYGEYTSVGFDTWGTYFVTAKGSYDPKSKTITMYGEDKDPVAGRTQKYNMIYRLTDQDSIHNEVIMVDAKDMYGVDEFKMVEVEYTRAE